MTQQEMEDRIAALEDRVMVLREVVIELACPGNNEERKMTARRILSENQP